MSAVRLLLAVVLLAAIAESAPRPFFDAIYDALAGNSRRSYGYGGYGNYGYDGYGYDNGYANPNYGYKPRNVAHAPRRQGKSYKDLCRVHYPDSVAVPGTGGIICPY